MSLAASIARQALPALAARVLLRAWRTSGTAMLAKMVSTVTTMTSSMSVNALFVFFIYWMYPLTTRYVITTSGSSLWSSGGNVERLTPSLVLCLRMARTMASLRVFRVPSTRFSQESCLARRREGVAMAAMRARMATAMSISISVNAFFFFCM